MPKKQKPANKTKLKPNKLPEKTASPSASLETLLNTYESQSVDAVDDFIDGLVKQPLKESLFELVSGLFYHIGIKISDDLKDDQNLTVKKSEYAEKIAQKAGLKTVKDTKSRTAFRSFLYRLMRSAFPIDGKSNKKGKLTLFDHLSEWLVLLAGSKARKVRVEATKLLLSVISELCKEHRLLEKAQFKTFFNYMGSKFLLPRLKDIDLGIKQDLMNFMLTTIEKADQVFESDKAIEGLQLGTDLMIQAVVKLNEASYELRRQSIEFIAKALSSENVEISEQMVKVLKSHKNLLINAMVDAGSKEIEQYFKLFKGFLSDKQIFDNDDKQKLGLLIYHHNKRISNMAVEFWVTEHGMDRFNEEAYSENRLVDFLIFIQSICGKRYDSPTIDDYIDLGVRLLPYMHFSAKTQDVMDTLEAFVSKKYVKVQRTTTLTLLGVVIAAAIAHDKNNEPFIEDILHKNIDTFLKDTNRDDLMLEGFIQLYRFQLKVEDTSEFKGRIYRLNSLMEETREFQIIKAVYGLYSKHRSQSSVISEQLDSNYVTYQKSLRQFYNESSTQNEFKYLLYKIRLIIKEFLITQNIYADFDLVFRILDAYTNETWVFDTEHMIKSCLGIIYECFYSDFLKLFKITEDFEAYMTRHRERRTQVISIFERFTNFSTDKNKTAISQKVSIRLESYSLLLNTYMLVSKDKFKTINFVYFYPNEQNVNRLRKYIEDSLFNDKKYDAILQTEHKRYIKNDFDDSQIINDIDGDGRRSIVEDLIDEEVGSLDHKKGEQDYSNELNVLKNNYQVYKFVCSKLVELLKTCSSAFEATLAHTVVLRFFIHDKSKTHFRPIIQDYLKTLLLKDTNTPEANTFWSCYYRCLLIEDDALDLISFSRFFAKIYLATTFSKTVTAEQQSALFRNFINCMLTVFKLSLTSKKGIQIIDVLRQVFIREPFFKENASILRNLLYKICVSRQESEKAVNLTPTLITKLEDLENHLAQMVGLFNRESLQDVKKTSVEIIKATKKEPEEIIKKLPSSTGLKKENIAKVMVHDDGYKIKRKNMAREESIKESNETTSFDQKRSIKS